MRTRDVLRWHFAPLDMLTIAGIALAGFFVGVFERVIDRMAR